MSEAARRVLIVDDEAPARDRLDRLIGEIEGWSSIGACADGDSAVRRVERERPGVVLLDVRMPGMSGIEVAQHLCRLDRPPAVIFTTAYDEYALEAFDSRAVGYLLKPVRRKRLASALAHAARVNHGLLSDLSHAALGVGRRRHIAARARDELRLIALEDIRYFEADQKYVTVYHANGQDLIEESLKQLEDEFGDLFVRIHRGALVAVDAIEAVEKDAAGSWRVRLRGRAETLRVSRRQVTDLKTRLDPRR